MDYENHADVLQALTDAQEADSDNRENARENWLFVNKKDGQWEPTWWNQSEGKPRYTFDMCNPIIDQIAGELEKSEFAIKVSPQSGGADKDVAQVYEGLLRNIETISNAPEIYNAAGRLMITTGLDGWRIVQKYVDDNSFDQDLVIQRISNFIDRVWFDPNAEEQDKSDAEYCYVLQAISLAKYDERWPEGSRQSVSEDRCVAYYNKPDFVVVGEFYYVKYEPRELVQMSNGSVYEVDEDFEQVKDELATAGILEVKRRTRKDRKVCIRRFDGGGWLDKKPKDTVFSYVPVIPSFANYSIFENKQIYWGAVEKLIDAQRVLNYSMSREIEEGSLAPRAKYWMTKTQAKGFAASLSTLNVNSDPVQFYNNDAEVPGPPQQQGGAQINAGLKIITDTMRDMINQQAGFYAANLGDNPNAQSGVAINALQERGDSGNIRYFRAQKVAIRHTGRILVNAIPKIIDGEREIPLVHEDGSQDTETVNKLIVDRQTGNIVAINDLSQGTYNVSCNAGPSFNNKQEKTVASIIELANVYPQLVERGADILLNNINAPGMEQLAERERLKLFGSMQIPESQMTDEEQQKYEEIKKMQMQGPPPDPAAMELAKAEQMKAKAQIQQAQTKMADAQAKAQISAERNQIDKAKVMQDGQLQQAKMGSNERTAMLTASQKSEQFRLEIKKQQQDIIIAMQEQKRKTDETMSTIQLQNAKMMEILAGISGQWQDRRLAAEDRMAQQPKQPLITADMIAAANLAALEED